MLRGGKYEQIIQRLCEYGFNAYLIGGSIRDLLLNSVPYDFDIATEATPEEIMTIFYDWDVRTIGKSFKVCLVDGIEVATYRKDRYYGLSDKNCEIFPAESVYEDLERRDLTINSLAMCPISGDLIDPYDGYNDIQKRIIRLTNDPEKRIYEDPNRIIRACRFLAKIEGEFDLNTFNSLRNNVELIKYVTPERIRLEILKAMEYPKASLFFSALESIKALEFVFPELCYSVNHEGGKYHDENIFEHSMLVGDSISTKFPLIKLTGYLHDVGKPYSYDPIERSFKGHDKSGEEICRERLKELRFKNYEINFISNLIKHHMRSIKNLNKKSIRRLLKVLDDDNLDLKDLIRLKIADRHGNINKEPFKFTYFKKNLRMVEEIYNEKFKFKISDLDINGKDLIHELNFKQGPQIGKALNFLFTRVMENPNLNEYDKLIKIIRDEFLEGE